ncbi:MAG: prepilin-type N-terminal cleavage/methylation domain-containing protein [Minisyncoccia bacterium]
MNMNFVKKNKNRGFTLLELLIVIAIIAILSVALVLVLNPAETLKKARDAQRISDLNTIKTAIGLYMTTVAPVYLGGTSSNAECQAVTGTWAGTNKIFYSLPVASVITDVVLDGVGGALKLQVATPSLTDSTGWIPVDFGNIAGGSPISKIPVDPINTITALGAVASTDLVYRYGCAQSPLAFEIDAQLESIAYTVTTDMRATDGGNNAGVYEDGTDLLIFGTGADF